MSRKHPGRWRAPRRAALILASFALPLLATPSRAMLVPARQAMTRVERFDRKADMKTVQKALESKILRERLHELGLSDKEINARLNRLSDAQIHELAQDIRSVEPGGISLVGLLVIVILVLLIVYLIHRV